jgi:aspartate aminotransferase
VIYLNIGQPDMPTPPEMIAELHGLSLARLAYAPSEGLPEARAAWSAFFASWGIDFAPDEILVTAGASEAITFILPSSRAAAARCWSSSPATPTT